MPPVLDFLVVESRGSWAAWCEFFKDIPCQQRLRSSLLAVLHFGSGQWVHSCNILSTLCFWLTLTEHLLLCQVLLALTGINSSKLPKDPVVIRIIIICILWMEDSGPERLKDLPKVAWLRLCVLNHFCVWQSLDTVVNKADWSLPAQNWWSVCEADN